MNILIAPDSFKGSCSSLEAATYIERGVKKVFPLSNTTKLSVADGGEGTVETILQSKQGELISEKVTGPLGEPVNATYAMLNNKTAIIEMASASGLTIVPDNKKDALKSTTYGTGQLLNSAINRGAKRIIIGIGGSATTDGGVGMAQALGYSFNNAKGEELPHGGLYLQDIQKINMSEVNHKLFKTEIIVACDVNNPLYGEQGAAFVYGPQKGANPEMVKILDNGLRHLDKIVRSQLREDLSEYPGSGAAGGLGFGLLAFCKGHLDSGIKIVLDVIDFDSYLEDCDLIITGEGRIDGQSVNGKVPIGIAEIATKRCIPVIVISGGIGDDIDEVYSLGINSIMSTVNSVMDLPEALKRTEELMIQAAERSMRMIKIGIEMNN